ncbi:putative polysaccharide biosynthesis protein [Trichinella spiralis]|uniref:putative polysaccharide biosynthesis protein n=1 Tax=Trichinella spiralis TaxID=6334 RepID=UPI0001EFD42A|nr:putative polysaccharide biosynthesis protein [Trichinella spiralis]
MILRILESFWNCQHLEEIPIVMINNDVAELNIKNNRQHKKLSVSNSAPLIYRTLNLSNFQPTVDKSESRGSLKVTGVKASNFKYSQLKIGPVSSYSIRQRT